MCSCKTVGFSEVMYASKSGRQLPYHKDCGEWLSDAQAKKYNEEKTSRWDEDKRRDMAAIRNTVARMSYGDEKVNAQECLNCGSIAGSPMAYCPYCRSTRLRFIEVKHG